MPQAELQSLFGEAFVVLFAGESLFLGGSDDVSVAHQTGRAVVVEGGDSQDVRRCCIV